MDDTFNTVVGPGANLIPTSKWQVKTKFKSETNETRKRDVEVTMPFLGRTDVEPIKNVEEIPQNEGDNPNMEQEFVHNIQQGFNEPPPISKVQHPQPIEKQPNPNVRRSGRQRRPPT